MKKRFVILTSLAVCITGILGGCGSDNGGNPFTGDKTKEPAYQANLNAISPAAYRDADGLELEPGSYISIIGKDDSSAYWKTVQAGVEQAAEDLNAALGYSGEDKIKVTYNAPDSVENIDEQVNILDEELARYPDALGIASIDESASTVQFDLAAENGIPIIALDSGNAYQGIQCTCKTDNADAEKTGAYKLCDEIEDEGEVVLFVHDSISSTAKEREESFKAEIAANHPNVTIAETIYCDQLDEMKKTAAEEMNAEKGEEEAEITADSLSDEDVIQYYLDKHPEVKGCFGTNITATQLIVTTLRQMENTENVVVMGFDAGESQLKALESGEIKGLVVQNPFGIGYSSVIAAARSALEIGNEAVVNTGYIWVTQENMEQDSIKDMLYE